MTSDRNNHFRGFSLVELVIVLVILGVVSAIAVVRIDSSKRKAAEAALRVNLKTIRKAIDRYYLEHHNTYPGVRPAGAFPAFSAAAFKAQLLWYSDIRGNVSENKDPAFPLGPYLRGQIRPLPLGTNAGERTIYMVNQVAEVAAEVPQGKGWIYNPTTGQFIANADRIGTDGVTYDKY